jgi:hypothetical protein
VPKIVPFLIKSLYLFIINNAIVRGKGGLTNTLNPPPPHLLDPPVQSFKKMKVSGETEAKDPLSPLQDHDG